MANVYCEDGFLETLQASLDAAVYDDMRLFKNNHTPASTDTVSDYTEADFSGYPGSVGPTWGAPFINGDDKGEIDAAPVTYTHNGGATANTIYGVYFLDADGDLVYADRFGAPIVLTNNGETFDYTAKTTVVNE